MDVLIIKYWLLTFVGIVLFLGGLTYFIQRQTLIDKFELNQMNQQGRRSSASNRRKNARNANKKKQQQQQQTITNTDSNNSHITKEEEEERKRILPKIKTENDEKEFSGQQSDEEQEEKEKMDDTIQTKHMISSPTHVEDEQEPTISIKQCNKTKTMNKPPPPSLPSSKEESIIPSKPQASVAPVKQLPSTRDSLNNLKSYRNQEDNNPKSNGHLSSSPSYNNCTYSAYNPLPPRFQQQRQQQKEAAYATQRHRRRRRGGVGGPQKRSSFPPDSAERCNDFIPSSLTQQQIDNNQTESLVILTQQQELAINNGYSSESDILTDSPSNEGNNSLSPLMSTSIGSQSSLQRLDLIRSLATSHGLLDELVSIFDTISFSSDELELILSKIATKHILDKHDLQRLISSTKNDKTLERILDETYRSQAKILAIELQSEKNRVLELTKTNADMENTIRQLHQQPNNIVQYQQMILTFQMQLRRLADENARLQYQLHGYSMMPATLNELKQQQNLLNEQIRQMSIRNSALENEVAESQRASKHAAELYKKADTQKQEHIEQMIADINKYKKLDKELTNLRQKHTELDKNLNSKITEITNQRDELQIQCDQLKDQLIQNPTNQIEQELNNLKTNNDQLRQSNWKNMGELNKLLIEQQQQNQDTISP